MDLKERIKFLHKILKEITELRVSIFVALKATTDGLETIARKNFELCQKVTELQILIRDLGLVEEES